MDNKLVCIFCQVATFHSADELLTHLRIHTGDIAEVDLVSTDSEETRSIVNSDNEQEGGPLGSISSERTESTCGSWENEGTIKSPSLSVDGVEVENGSDSRTAPTSGPRSAPVTLQRAKRQLLQQFDDSERKAPPLESYPPRYQRMPRIVAVQGGASISNNAGYDGVTWTAPCGISSTSQVPERSIHPDEPHKRHPDDEPQQPPALQLGKGTHPDTPQLNSSATREFGQSAMETANNPTAPIADLTPWARHQHLSSAPYLSTFPQAYGIPHVQQAQLTRDIYNQTIPLHARTICSTREGNVYPSSVAPGVGSSKAPVSSYYDNISSMPLAPFPRPGFDPYHPMEPVSKASPLLKSQNVGIDQAAPPFVNFADMSHSYVTQVTPSVATSMSPCVTNFPPVYFPPLPSYIAHTATNVSQASVTGVSPTIGIGNVPTAVISKPPPAAIDDVPPTIGDGIGYPFIPSFYPGMSGVLQSTHVTSGLSPRIPDMPPKPDLSANYVLTKPDDTDELSPRVTNVPSSSIPAYEFPSGKVILLGSPLRGKKRILSPPPKYVMLSPKRGECKTSSKPRALKVVKTFQIKELGLHTLQPNTNESPVYKVSRSPSLPAAITSSKSPQLIKRAHTMPFATTRGKLSEDKSPVEMFKEAASAEDLTECAAIQSTVLGSTESSQSSQLIKRAHTLPLTTTGGPPSQDKFVEVPKERTSSKDSTESVTRPSTSQSSRPPKDVVSSGSHGKKAIWIKLPEGSTWVPPTKNSSRPSSVKAGTQPFKFTTRINSTDGDSKKIVDVPIKSSLHLSSTEPRKTTCRKVGLPSKELPHSSPTEAEGSVATSKQRIISCSISEGCKIRKRVKLPSKDLSHPELVAAAGVVKSQCSNSMACDGSCPLCQPQIYPTKIAPKAQPSDDPNSNAGYDSTSSEHEQHVATSTTKSLLPGHVSISVDSSAKTTSNASMSGDDEKTISSTIEDQDLQSMTNNPDGSSSADDGYIVLSETLAKPSQSSQSSEDDVLIVPTPTKLTKAMKSSFALSTVKTKPLSNNDKASDDKTKLGTKHVSCLTGGGDFETSSSSVQEFGIRTLARVSDSCIDLKLKIEVVNGKGRLTGEPGDGDKQCSATIRSKIIASSVKPIRFRCPKCLSGFQRITDQMKHKCKGRKEEKSLDLSTAFARLKMFKCLDCLEEFATIEEKMQHPCTQRKPEVRESSDDDKSPSKKREKKRGRPRKEEAVDPMMAQEYHYPCQHCGKWFLKEAHLRCHTAFCPQNEAKPKWENTVPGAPVWCICCGRMFVRKRFLGMHLMWNNNCKAMYEARGMGYLSNQPTGATPNYPDIDIKKEPKDVDNGEETEVHKIKMEIESKDQCNKMRKLTDSVDVNEGKESHSFNPPSSKTSKANVCLESDGDPDCENARPGGSQCPFCKDDSRIFPSLQALSMHTMYAHNKTVYRRRSGWYFGDASPTEGKHHSNYGTIPTAAATEKKAVNLWTCLLCTDISYVFISKDSYVAHYKAKHGITAVGESLISDKVVSVRSAAPTPDGDVPQASVELDVLDLTEGQWDTGELCESKVNEVTMDVYKGNEFKPGEMLKEQQESSVAVAASVSSEDTSGLTQSCQPAGSDKSKKTSTTTTTTHDVQNVGPSVALEQEKPKAINVNTVQSSVVKKWISGSLNRKNDVPSSSAYHGQQLSNRDVVNSLEAKTEHSKKEASAKSSVHSSSSTELGRPKAAGVDVIHSSQTDLYHCCHCRFATPLYSATQRHLMILHNIRRPNISQPGSDESSNVKMSSETRCQVGRSAVPTEQRNRSSSRSSTDKSSVVEFAPTEQGKTSYFQSSTERSSVAEFEHTEQGTTSSSTSRTDRSSVAEFQYRKLISAQRTVSPTFQKATTGYVCLVCKAEVPNGGRKYHAKKNRHVEYKCGVCSLTFVGKRNVIKHVKATHGDVIGRMKEVNTMETEETVMSAKPAEPELTSHASTAGTVSSDSDVKGKNRFLRELGMQIVADNISKTTTKCEPVTSRVSNVAKNQSENVASGQHKEVNIAAKIPVHSAPGKPEENKTDDVDQVQSDTNTSSRMSDSDQAPQNCENSISSVPDISTSKDLDAIRPVVEGKDYTKDASGIVLDESFAYIEVGPKKLECPLCKKVVKPYLRKRHMVSHTNKDGYHCSHCSYKTTHQHNVVQHVHLQHRDKAWIKNSYVIDQEIIREGRKLAREKTVDQGTGFATCSYCLVFISKQALAIHMLQHMEKNPYKCKLCEYSCKQPISIQLHAKNHHAPWASKKTRCDKKTGDDALGRSKRRADQKKNPGKTTVTGKRVCTGMDATRKKTASEGNEMFAEAKTEKSEVQGGEGTSQKLMKKQDCHTKNSMDNGGPKEGEAIFDFTDSDGEKLDGVKESAVREKQWKVKQFYKEIKESRPAGDVGLRKMQDSVGKNSLFDSEHLSSEQLQNTSEQDHDIKTAPRAQDLRNTISNLTKRSPAGQYRGDVNGSRCGEQKTENIKQTSRKMADTDVTNKCAVNDAAKGTKKITESQGWRSRAWKINSGHPNPYQCNYCNFQTSKVSSIRTHMVVKHNKQRSWIKAAYTCDEKALKESVDLAMEQPCDASSKQYTCSFCKRICIGKNGMAVHILQHTGANPFQCNLCSYQCKQIVSIELHVKKMHVGAVVKSSTVGGVGNRVAEHSKKNVECPATGTSERDTEKELTRKTVDGDENPHCRKDHSAGSKHLSTSRIGEKCRKDETSRESSGRTGISSTGECHVKPKDASKNETACEKTKSEQQKCDLPLPSKSTDGMWKFAAEGRASDSGRETNAPMRVPKKRKLEQMETENTVKKQKVHRDQGIGESIAITKNEKEQQQCATGKLQLETVEAEVGTSKQNSSHLDEKKKQNVSQKPHSTHATDDLSTRVIQYLQKKKRQVILECGKEQSQKQTVSLECDSANNSETTEKRYEKQSGNHTVLVLGSSNELEKPHHANKPSTSKSSMDISAPQSVKRVVTQPSLTYDPRKKQKVSQIMVENPRKTVNDVRMAKASFPKMDYLSVLKQRYLHRERDLGAKVWSEDEMDNTRKQTTSECTTSYGTEKGSEKSSENIKNSPMATPSSQQAKRARTSPHQEFKGKLKQKTPKKGFIKKEEGATQDDTDGTDTEMGTLFKTSHLYDLTEMYYFNKLTQKYLCKECDMDFKSPRKAATHCEDHSDLCMYMCQCCSYSSRYLECINCHIQLCHRAQLKSVQSSSKADMVHEQTVKVASSQAEDCFLMMKTLRDKKQRPHRDIESENFVCQCCGYMSSSYHKVEEHTRKHTGEKVYHCLVCIEKGSRHNEMVKHVVLCHLKRQEQTKTIGHEGDKPVGVGSVRKHTGHDARHKKEHCAAHKETVLNRSARDTKIGERTPQSVDQSDKRATDDVISNSNEDTDGKDERNVWQMFDSP